MANDKNHPVTFDPLYSAIATLGHTIDRQWALIDRLTAPEPSLWPELIPFVSQLAQLLIKPSTRREEMGPAERYVMAEFEAAHAKLMIDFDEKRAAARAKDEETRRAEKIAASVPKAAA